MMFVAFCQLDSYLIVIGSSYSKAECKPLSYDTCREFAIQFDRLYEGRNETKYSHPNPMLKTTTSLNHAASDKDFFDSIQFPIEYTFPQDQDTGAVDRTFAQTAFADGTSLHDKAFSLVNSDTGKALSLSSGSDCASLRIIDEVYNVTDSHQHFKLNDKDQLESVACTGKVFTLSGECIGGAGLVLSDSNAASQAQKWRLYEDGIVNLACGRMNGNLAITSVEDDALSDIPYLDDISFSFVNPSTGKAIGIGDVTQVSYY